MAESPIGVVRASASRRSRSRYRLLHRPRSAAHHHRCELHRRPHRRRCRGARSRGRDLQHRIALARSVSMRANAGAADGYETVPVCAPSAIWGPTKIRRLGVHHDRRPAYRGGCRVRAGDWSTLGASHRGRDRHQRRDAARPSRESQARVRFVAVEISIEPCDARRRSARPVSSDRIDAPVFITYRGDAPAGWRDRARRRCAVGARRGQRAPSPP